eukprot:TRINITY_DN708_c0_g2_i2.p1 TRINITY_DN708_c0_g2~~TRINITY_DN708_c0_g2_i2.p1  ORF type:complete len:417 (-),score=95.55 TRINITY_DN708_c0_g2_i2:2-1108(-)
MSESCALSFAAICQPMNEQSEMEVPVVNFGKIGVIRCRRCRAYVNAFVKWRSSGRKWQCNLCSAMNEVPDVYQSPLDGQSGRRVDLLERPELCNSSYEIIAPDEYTIRAPQSPAYMFLIHVNTKMVQSGALQWILDCILACVDGLPGEERTRIAFGTYDSKIHVYSMKQGAKMPQMLTIPDVEDPIMPAPWDDIFVVKETFKDMVNVLLEKLGEMFLETTDEGNCMGSAVDLMCTITQQIGGKLSVFNWGRPNVGKGVLVDRAAALPSQEPERLHELQLGKKREVEDYYVKAVDATKYQLSIDLYQFADHEFCDLGILREMCLFNGGDLRFYPAFRNSVHGTMLYQDLRRSLTRETGRSSETAKAHRG